MPPETVPGQHTPAAGNVAPGGSEMWPISRVRNRLAKAGVTYRPAAVHHMAERGEFPAPIRFSSRKHLWYAEEIEAWIESRLRAVGRAA